MKKIVDRSILDYDDSGKELVEVPEWNGCVYVRRLTVNERLGFAEQMSNVPAGKIPKGAMEEMVATVCVDENGQQIFTPDDHDRLCQKTSSAIERIFNAAAELNGLTAKSVEKIAKK